MTSAKRRGKIQIVRERNAALSCQNGSRACRCASVARSRRNPDKFSRSCGDDEPLVAAVRNRQESLAREIKRRSPYGGSASRAEGPDGGVGKILFRVGKSPGGVDPLFEGIAAVAPKAILALGAVKALTLGLQGLNTALDYRYYHAKGDVQAMDDVATAFEAAWRRIPIIGDLRQAARDFFESDDRHAVQETEKDIKKQEEKIAKMKEAASNRKQQNRDARVEQSDLLAYQREFQRKLLEGELGTYAAVAKAAVKAVQQKKQAAAKEAGRATPGSNDRARAERNAADAIDRAERDNARAAADLADRQRRRRAPIKPLKEGLEAAAPPDTEGGRTSYSSIGGLSSVHERLRREREDIIRKRYADLRDMEVPEAYALAQQQQKRLAAAQRAADRVRNELYERVGPYATSLTPNSVGPGGKPEFTAQPGDPVVGKQLVAKTDAVLKELQTLNKKLTGETVGVLRR